MNFHVRSRPGADPALNAPDAGRPVETGLSIRALLVLLAVGLAIPLLAFSGYLIWLEAQAQRTAYEAELRQTAHQIDVALGREFNVLVTLLDAVAKSPPLLGNDLARFHDQVANLRGLPGVNISLRDTSGKILVSARVGYGDPDASPSIVRDFDARMIREKSPVMSNVTTGVTRGSPSVAAAIPVLQDGEVEYFLQANLPTEYFANLLRDFKLGGDMSAFIVDRNNVVVALSRDHAEYTGKPNDVALDSPNTMGLVRGFDRRGARVVGVIVESAATEWCIGVIAPEDVLEAPRRRALMDLAALGLAFAAIGLLLAYLFGRKISSSIHALAVAGEGLRRSDFPGFAATPVSEVNEVARSLDAASARLRASEARLRESEAWLRESLRVGRAFVFEADVATDTITVSGGGADFYGFSGDDPLVIQGREFRMHIHPNDYPGVISALMSATPANPMFEPRFRFQRPGFDVLWVGMRSIVRHDAKGNPLRLSGLAFDITESVQAGETRARLAAVVETSRDMIISVAPGGEILTWNSGAERIFGYTAAEAVGKSLRMLVPDDVGDFDDIVRAMQERGSINVETVRMAKDGRRINVLISSSSIRMPDGARGSSAIFTDITERKRSEARQRTLINELNHRVKNTLATIQSIARHTFRDEANRAALDTFGSRLIALSAAHNVLTRSSWEGADLAEIVDNTIAPHRTAGDSRFRVSGPPVWLDPRGALAVALALHELCTNAAKYGALSRATGAVDLAWRREPCESGEKLVVAWRESGGPPVVEPATTGFGTRLLHGVLADDLDAVVRMRYAPDGFCCDFEAPLREVGDRAGGKD